MAEQHRCVFLTAPGESLLTVRAPHAVEDLVLSRRLRWCAATGQSLGDLVTTPLVGVPIPVYRELDGPEPPDGAYDPRRQFPRVHPSALRHPLFWLPMRLAARQLFSDGTAETDEEWTLRVAIECTESGLYDEATGSWFDVLASVGLDVDDPVDEARVESWQRGGPDPVLDGIDLSEALDIVDRDWAMVFTAELLPALRQATWARLSRDLRRDFEFLTATDLHIETTTMLRETKILADLALSSVAEAPRPDTEHDRVAEWSQVRADLSAIGAEDRDALLAGPVTQAMGLLEETYDDYEEVLELVLQLLPPGQPSTDQGADRGASELMSDDEVAADLSRVIDAYRTGVPLLGRERMRMSLAGAQPKLALVVAPDGSWRRPAPGAPTTHILKPEFSTPRTAADERFPDLTTVELFSLSVARHVGLRTPQARMWTSPDGQVRALVVSRYDRKVWPDGQVRRIHQEDLCQALSVPPGKKYQLRDGGPGVGKVGELLRASLTRIDRLRVAQEFLALLTLNVAMVNTDAHAKNYSLMLQLLAGVNADGRAYDWREEAQCAQTDPEAFFPEKGGSTREAKGVCAVCPVRQACLEWAIETGEKFGVWGGLSERERRAYAKANGLAFGSRRLPGSGFYGDFDDVEDGDEGDLSLLLDEVAA